MQVNVVYAETGKNWSTEIDCPENTSVWELVQTLRDHELFQHIDFNTCSSFAVWNQQVDSHYMLSDGDRLEILRPLEQDPKDLRRMRAIRR